MLQSYAIFVFQLLAHLALLFGLFTFNPIDFFLLFSFYFLFTAIGSDATYHRLLAHDSYTPPKWFYILGNLFGVLGGVGSGIAWVANHRAHHRYADTEKDPHSPLYKSFLEVVYLSMFAKVKIGYAGKLLKDKSQIFFHRFYWPIHLTYFVLLLTIYPQGIISMYLGPAALTWTVSGFINYFCHGAGYRVENSKDKSTNNLIIGLISFGEGYHNYHHANPKDYRFGYQKFEFDLVARIIEWVDPMSTKISLNKSAGAEAFK